MTGMSLGYGGSHLGGGVLTLPCVSVYSISRSGSVLNLTGSSVDIRVDSLPPLGAGSTEAQFQVRYDDNNYFMIYYGDGAAGLTARIEVGGTHVADHVFVAAYSSVTHRYWRVREASGTVYFGTSPDRITWTEYSAAHTLGVLIRAMRLLLSVGYWGTETSPGPMIVGKVNAA